MARYVISRALRLERFARFRSWRTVSVSQESPVRSESFTAEQLFLWAGLRLR